MQEYGLEEVITEKIFWILKIIDAAISAAEAVGDDNIQKRSQGYVNQEAFTHGSSAQRKEWFMKGYNTGDIRQGNTFEALR